MGNKTFQKPNKNNGFQQYGYLQKSIRYRVAITFVFASVTILMTYFYGLGEASLYFMCTLASIKDIGDTKLKIVYLRERLKIINEDQGKKERYELLQKEFPTVCLCALLCVIVCGLFLNSVGLVTSILFVLVTISFIMSALRMNMLRKAYQQE